MVNRLMTLRFGYGTHARLSRMGGGTYAIRRSHGPCSAPVRAGGSPGASLPRRAYPGADRALLRDRRSVRRAVADRVARRADRRQFALGCGLCPAVGSADPAELWRLGVRAAGGGMGQRPADAAVLPDHRDGGEARVRQGIARVAQDRAVPGGGRDRRAGGAGGDLSGVQLGYADRAWLGRGGGDGYRVQPGGRRDVHDAIATGRACGAAGVRGDRRCVRAAGDRLRLYRVGAAGVPGGGGRGLSGHRRTAAAALGGVDPLCAARRRGVDRHLRVGGASDDRGRGGRPVAADAVAAQPW